MQYYVLELPQESMAQEAFGARQFDGGAIEVRSRQSDDGMLNAIKVFGESFRHRRDDYKDPRRVIYWSNLRICPN